MECLRDRFDSGVVLNNGRYQTISPLNHGSFGMVFMAKDLQANETVAIKCLTKKAAVDEFGLDLAIDDKSEELALHKLLGSHPNIVSLIDSFETDAHVYLVLEFCGGGDLYEAIRHGYGPLETEHVRTFMLELVDAVTYMHSKGVYHRDIKPENIFLTDSGSMKLGDFGLATTEEWTYEGTVGSDRYMSPEQYESEGAGYSPGQADIWAIGICLLNILFSRNPFTMPSEADPLFLDFSRDKQSLFDVFPSMSQDTYEVIVQCMNLDPKKRSLVGVRNALRRVVSFTTQDEQPDDFCSAERRTVATSNREPLRTPSIQSPQVDNCSFPWAKALHATSPQPIRQLSMIADDESYIEDLFSKSEMALDWCSATTGQTPSMDSILNSSLGASISSLAMDRNQKLQLGAKVSPTAGSLPITMSKNRHQSAMSMVFGRKDGVSKSWSDMWEEDEEEEENERARQLQTLKELNSRTWSHESKVSRVNSRVSRLESEDDDDTPRLGLSPATKASALSISSSNVPSIEHTITNNIDEDFVADGFFFHDAPAEKQQQPRKTPQPSQQLTSSRYSPPSKRSAVDKWAALGERRRAYTGSSTSGKSPNLDLKASGQSGNGYGFSSLGHGVWDHFNLGHQSNNNSTSHYTFNNTPYNNQHNNSNYHGHNNLSHHQHGKWNAGKDRIKECPWNKGRDSNWRRDRRPELDLEWVGGW